NAVPATPTITANPGFTACTSTTLSGSITSGVTYQWNLGGSPITGATNNTYAATASGTYTQTVKNASNCTATSASQTVTINAVPATPTITANPGFTACTSTTLSGSITSGVTYQWNLGGSPITGATNNTYAATASGTYTQTVKNASNCTATSASQTVTINAVPATSTITANPGFTACTSTTLSGSITSGVTYQWNLAGSPITGATNNTYAATASGTYTQTITNASNCSATSASQTVTINAVPATPTVTNGSTCGTG